MKISNHQLIPALRILSNISFPNTISVDSITGLITATSEIQGLYDNFQKSTKALMESYGLTKNEDEGYYFEGHEKESEIKEKWVELLNKVNEIDVTLSEDSLYAKLGHGLHIQEVLLLKEVLN